jgi:ADP-ribosylglycohydrolase
MNYTCIDKSDQLFQQIKLYFELKAEYGAGGISETAEKLENTLEKYLQQIKSLPIDKTLASKEPDLLEEIKKIRPEGPRNMGPLDIATYKQKLAGALLGRMAGCTLGAPVEFWTIERMENLARQNGMPFPPDGYWTYVDDPFGIRYLKGRRDSYTRDKMDGVPVDDDIEYILTGLVIAEKHGIEFTTADVGKIWQELLPMAYTAEKMALENLNKGIDALDVADTDNPYCEWIGADIRCDPWAYMSPGNPERAAEFAHRDAYLSHRRQGIYGEMYFAAAISAAFSLDDPMTALEAGLVEIPAECELAKAVRWALDTAPSIKNYKDARAAVDKKFKGMNPVHTINNACLTIFGVAIGKTDFSKVISETVAMGLDNDCTAATAGSLVGATIGIDNIPEHWYRPFKDTIYSYSKTCEKYSIKDVLNRFTDLAKKNGCIK